MHDFIKLWINYELYSIKLVFLAIKVIFWGLKKPLRLEGRGLISFFMLFYVQKSLFHLPLINLCQAKKVQFCYLRKIFFHKIPKKVSRRDYGHLQHLNWVLICWIGQNTEKYFLWILSLGSILSEGSVPRSPR